MPFSTDSSGERFVRAFVIALILVCSQSGAAKTFIVDTTVDSPDGNILDGICSYLEVPNPNVPTCSLRAAVTQANAISTMDAPGPITIWLDPGKSYYIGGQNDDEVSGRVGDLDIQRPMDIGVNPLFPKAKVRRTEGDDRIFDLHPGATGTRLQGMQLKNSQAGGVGCILWARAASGTLLLDHIEVVDSDCSFQYGSVVLNNTPTTITDSEFKGGKRALWLSAAVATIERTTIDSQYDRPAVVLRPGSNLTVRDSTFSGNHSAFHALRSNLFIMGSTFSGSTLEHISFKADSGGLMLRITNSLFAGGARASCSFYDGEALDPLDDVSDFEGLVHVGGSVFDDQTCVGNSTPPAVENLYQADVTLSPLGAYGGLTRTHTLLPGSDGIDWIAPQHCQSNGKDQRGLPRAVDYSGIDPAHCDAGSTELQLVEAPPQGHIFSDGLEGD